MITTTPCPVCGYGIRSNQFDDLIQCNRCDTIAHAPCFWRMLPLEERVAYLRWLDTEEMNRDFTCAACRQLEGLGERGGH